MLINCDIKSLEIVVAAELSQDPVLCQEIRDKVDLHERNKQTLILPTRLIAKVFVFRLIYGGSAYAYSVDNDFSTVGKTQKQWQEVINTFYAKYKGLKKWHDGLVRTAKEFGIIEIPSGRFYEFKQMLRKGEPYWHRPIILNYPVQGFGADLVMLARIEFFRRFKESGLEGCFIQTVHDSLVVDTPSKNVDTVARMLSESVDKVPELCYTNWNYKFSLPMTCEIQVGMNKKDLTEYKLH